jgi:hypothetical protein
MKIAVSELLPLLTWSKSRNILFKKPFLYDDYMVELFYLHDKEDIIDFDVNEIMEDLYPTFISIDGELYNNINTNNNDLLQVVIDGITTFRKIYSNVLLNNKHDSAILNKYKKEYLNTLLNKYISEEKYEDCIYIRNKLSDFDENI